jgi:hypothetical protein
VLWSDDVALSTIQGRSEGMGFGEDFSDCGGNAYCLLGLSDGRLNY